MLIYSKRTDLHAVRSFSDLVGAGAKGNKGTTCCLSFY